MSEEEARARDEEALKQGPQWFLDRRADQAQFRLAFPSLLDQFEDFLHREVFL